LNKLWDTVIVGAGAAGLYCAIVAGRRGKRVLIIDHSTRIAEKIRISGGGRCNFTNQELDPQHPERHYISENPDFCRSALARYTPRHFIEELDRYGLSYHEKHRGQLFCDQGSPAIIDFLIDSARQAGVEIRHPVSIQAIDVQEHFTLSTTDGPIVSQSLVIATGGLSIPQIGATDFGYRIAKQFGHRLIDPRPALVPLKFASDAWAPFSALAGVAVNARVKLGPHARSPQFDDDLLLTHRGLSGPAILQISSYWIPGEPLTIDLCPGTNLEAQLTTQKREAQKSLKALLQDMLPQRLVQLWLEHQNLAPALTLQSLKDSKLRDIAATFQEWQVTPSGTEGFKKAEVTRGGVDTRAISSKTMESSHQKGLYFIGEVVDVTGWLGGYNFQWAWASAHAAGLSV
jgi:predicted Rossmann fold flavoprotein